jgi:plasmid stability protein
MGQIIVRNLDDAVIERLKEKAKRDKTSLEQTVREALTEAARPSRAEIIEEARRIRERIGKVSGHSTEPIRRDRDTGYGREWPTRRR